MGTTKRKDVICVYKRLKIGKNYRKAKSGQFIPNHKLGNDNIYFAKVHIDESHYLHVSSS